MNMKKFNEKMGRRKYSKGGYIKKIGNREYFDDGGIALNNVNPGALQGGATNTSTRGIGGISDALGLSAQGANIQSGTNAAQLNNAYGGANNAINAQVGLANTLQPQAETAAGNQNALAEQYLAMTKGQGPNPALNQLAQATGQNVNQQAALMAGQRGASGNVGLAARNIGQQGSNIQQNAAGQAATLQAEQQVAAQNNLANLANQQIGQTQGANIALNTAQQNEQNILQNANTSYNNTATGMQSNINNINAQANKGIMGALGSGLSAVTGGLFGADGGTVTKQGFVHPEKKHKLDFVHKMAKMGLEHFDSGGQVDVGSYTPSSPSDGPNIPETPSDSGSGGGMDMSKIAGVAAMAMSRGGELQAPPPPPPPVPSQSVVDAQNSMRKAFNYAEGGPIQPNPLIGAITHNPNSPMVQMPQYNQIHTGAGPNIEGTSSSSGPDLAESAKEGYSAGKKWKANRDKANAGLAQGQATFNSEYAGPSENVAAGGLGSDQFAKGGEIWNLHPSQHAEYSANHFEQYFSKGGKAKEVQAMVSANERYLNPEEVEMVKHGADPKKIGYKFPGKDKVPGKNSLKNDTIPVTLEEGGVVIPLSIEKTNNSDKMRLFTLKSLRATGKHMKRPKGMS